MGWTMIAHQLPALLSQGRLIFLLMLLPARGFGHGLNCAITPGSAGVLTATTIPGEPICFAEVKVFAPQNDSIEFA